jgi:hypothetical protein
MRLVRFGTYSLVALCSLFAAACGGGGSDDEPGDDAPPEGDHYKYVADSALVPTSTTEVQTYGLDLDSDEPDGDEGVDNQLGSVLSALAAMDFDIQGTVTTSVDQGDIILLADYQTRAFDSAANSGLSIYLGDVPTPAACLDETDTVCRRHLDGNGSFTVDADSPRDALVKGPVVNGVFQGGPGTLRIQIALSEGNPIPLDLIGARAELRQVSATNIGDGKLAGAISKSDIDNNILPAVKLQLDGTIAEDCPEATPANECMCTESGSTGDTVLSTFDANNDCAITVMELAENGLIAGFLMPDVRIMGVDALSIGLKFTAVGAQFTQ